MNQNIKEERLPQNFEISEKCFKTPIALFLVHHVHIQFHYYSRSGLDLRMSKLEMKQNFNIFFIENIFDKRKIGFEGEKFRVLILNFKFIIFLF